LDVGMTTLEKVEPIVNHIPGSICINDLNVSCERLFSTTPIRSTVAAHQKRFGLLELRSWQTGNLLEELFRQVKGFPCGCYLDEGAPEICGAGIPARLIRMSALGGGLNRSTQHMR